MSSVIHVVNPGERDDLRLCARRRYYPAGHRFVLWFGSCGVTRLMVWARSLEDAIEECGAWLAEHAPGHVMADWGDEHRQLISEACEERGVTFPDGFEALEDDAKWEIADAAMVDMTYTESGYLTSYEWGIDLEDPTRAQLMHFASEIGATFAYKVPK